MYLIKEMPKDERPRERLEKYGAKALSHHELLAILLRTGLNDKSVIDLAKDILYHLENVNDLEHISFQELLMIKGVKKAKASTVIAAIELGRRLSAKTFKLKQTITSPYDVYHYIHHELTHLKQEHFICLYLNIKNQVIKKETIFIGTISQMIIHPREIFKHAITLLSSSVIFVHNHPSGDATPSQADIKATE